SKSRAHFSPRGRGVESTAPNFVRPLRKRVADVKHGFKSCRPKEIAGEAPQLPKPTTATRACRAPAGRPRLRRELSGEVLRRSGSRSMGRYGPVVDDLRRRASELRSSPWA